jgi:xanthine dehydrogenase small subunit
MAMIRFLLNDQIVETDAPTGMAVLDFVRDRAGLKGTKHACREGDCGACLVLLGELDGEGRVVYRGVTSCLLPLGEVAGRHLVTVEGLAGSTLGPVHAAIVDEGASQCGFCTPGFVVAMTDYLLRTTTFDLDEALIATAGNLCRCTGYASIRRALGRLIEALRDPLTAAVDRVDALVAAGVLPSSFRDAGLRLAEITPAPLETSPGAPLVAGGSDLYVQRLHEIEPMTPRLLLRELPPRVWVEGGAVNLSATVTAEDLKRAPVLREILGDVSPFIDLICSQPIRERATIAGNMVNASPIGDMTILFLALDAELIVRGADGPRTLPLRELYLGYKQLDLAPGEIIEVVRFSDDRADGRLNFEKVSKRRYLDIASVNSAAWLRMDGTRIADVRLSAGGVAPVPLRLVATEQWLTGREATAATARDAAALATTEIAPITDVRGSAEYKRLLLHQLVLAHFHELCGLGAGLVAEVAV